jgi:serine/threonine-protein kinase
MAQGSNQEVTDLETTLALERMPAAGSRPWFQVGARVPRPLLEQIGGRVQTLCAVAGVAFTVHMLIRWVAAPHYYPLPTHPSLQVLSWAAFMVVVAGLAGVGRFNALRPRTLLDFALVVEVAGAFFIVLGDHQMPWLVEDPIRGISWVCLWIIAFQILVPAPSGRASIAAFTAAAMGPLALLLAVARGNPMPPVEFSVALFAPNFVAASAAVVFNAISLRMLADVELERDLGSYTLVRRLGSGGMGEVWLGRHNLLPRPAAVKIVKPEALRGDAAWIQSALSRFRREAAATAKLHSPHCVQLFDFGTTRDGAFFYAMEFLDGIDLQELLSQFGPQSAARTVFLLRQACHALAEAHAAGLIHRDVKPSNIYICRHGLECDYVKLLDFGLVKALVPEGDLERLTETGVVAGTPAYIAPETLLTPRDIDHRVDIYSLGCVAYSLLTARPPFEAAGKYDMVVQHLREEPVPPSAFTEVAVPPELDDLILACLRKDPAERPQTIQEVDARLRQVPLDPPWSYARAHAWWQLHLPVDKVAAVHAAAQEQLATAPI